MKEAENSDTADRIHVTTSSMARIPVLALMIGMIAVAASQLLAKDGPNANLISTMLGVLGVLSFGSAIGMLSFLFIRAPDTLRSEQHIMERQRTPQTRSLAETATIRVIEERISALETNVKAFDQASTRQLEEIAESVTERLNIASSEDVISRAQARLETELGQESTRAYARETFNDTRLRLTHERARLEKAGSYNLAIGGSISIMGIMVLAYYLFIEKNIPSNSSSLNIIAHYIPRVSLVILIEAFSLFFLRLYKSSLDDVRYFQNELTNIEQRLVAFEIAIGCDDQDRVGDLVKVALATERNFTLKKDETAIGIETAKIESNVSNIEFIKSIVPAFKKLDIK